VVRLRTSVRTGTSRNATYTMTFAWKNILPMTGMSDRSGISSVRSVGTGTGVPTSFWNNRSERPNPNR